MKNWKAEKTFEKACGDAVAAGTETFDGSGAIALEWLTESLSRLAEQLRASGRDCEQEIGENPDGSLTGRLRWETGAWRVDVTPEG